jgi:hypothetical protein
MVALSHVRPAECLESHEVTWIGPEGATCILDHLLHSSSSATVRKHYVRSRKRSGSHERPRPISVRACCSRSRSNKPRKGRCASRARADCRRCALRHQQLGPRGVPVGRYRLCRDRRLRRIVACKTCAPCRSVAGRSLRLTCIDHDWHYHHRSHHASADCTSRRAPVRNTFRAPPSRSSAVTKNGIGWSGVPLYHADLSVRNEQRRTLDRRRFRPVVFGVIDASNIRSSLIDLRSQP